MSGNAEVMLHDSPRNTAEADRVAQHTPRSWILDCGDHTHRYVHISDEDGLTVFYKYGAGSAAAADLDETNARLAAAAPEMLTALKACHAVLLMLTEPKTIRSTSTVDAWAQCIAVEAKARAAIAKATGQAPAS